MLILIYATHIILQNIPPYRGFVLSRLAYYTYD